MMCESYETQKTVQSHTTSLYQHRQLAPKVLINVDVTSQGYLLKSVDASLSNKL